MVWALLLSLVIVLTSPKPVSVIGGNVGSMIGDVVVGSSVTEPNALSFDALVIVSSSFCGTNRSSVDSSSIHNSVSITSSDFEQLLRL